MLADMGADVIKIEVPGSGDDSRQFGPFVNGESSYFMNLNRNKKGITLNLKSPEGKEIFRQLVKQSDIVLENYRPGTMEKLGLGYDELAKINPKIIYGCVSGFGHYGPYKNRAGYDIIGQAMGGLMSTTGWPDGEPTRTGTAMADVLAGLSVTIGVLAALKSRESTGKGQKVDVALVDSVVASLEIINQIYLITGENPQRIGNRYESVYPYDSFRASDGSLVIGCGNDKLFTLLTKIMNKPELAEDELFDRNPKRVKNHALLKPIIEEWTKDKTVDEVVDLLLNAGIPAAPINTIDRIVKDPHIAEAREMFVAIDHPKAGRLKITGSHLKFSDTKVTIRQPSPFLGQHNTEVLSEMLKLSEDEIEDLKVKGII
jgi:formyl-CoA transferase